MEIQNSTPAGENTAEELAEGVCEIKILFNHATDDDRGDSTEKKAVYSSALSDFLSANNIHFQELDVSDFYEEEPSPLLIVFGNDEIEQSDEKKLVYRRDKGFFTIPLVVFSEDYFRLPQGELFGYRRTIESINNACSLPAVAFSEAEVKGCTECVREFFLNVKHLYSTAELGGDASAACSEIYDIIEEFCTVGLEQGSDDFFFTQMLADAVRELSEKYLEVEDIAEDCRTKLESCAELFLSTQEKAAEAISIDRFGYKSVPEIKAVDFAAKYDKLTSRINEFMDRLDNARLLMDNAAVKRGIRCTREELAKGCRISVVGTFSSGKTMLINMLLNHPHKLRISSSHNTAVLTKLFRGESGREYAEIVYRSNIRIPLIEPMEGLSAAQLYTGDEPVRITDILYDMSGRTVVARGTVSEMVYCITIDNDKRIIVQRDSIVNPGAALTDGTPGTESSGFSRLAAEMDFSAVLDEIQNDTIKDIRLEVVTEDNRPDVLFGDDAVLTILEISESARSEQMVLPSSGGQLKYRKAVVLGRLEKENARITLDEDGWRSFCDSETGAVIAESAENRLFAEQINIYMNSGLLSCASIVDTPGAGSVMKRHDSVTERCIQDKNSLLTVVVKVNQNTERKSLNSLLQTISSIYETDNIDKSNVIFVLNCHTSSTSQAKLIRSCSSMIRRICNYGFDRDKIFAFDLKRVVEENERPVQMLGRFPSYEGFERSLGAAIEANGIRERIEDIRIFWSKLFAKEMSALEMRMKKPQEEQVPAEILPEVCEPYDDSRSEEYKAEIEAVNRKIDAVTDIQMGDVNALTSKYTELFAAPRRIVSRLDDRRAVWESGRTKVIAALKDAAAQASGMNTVTAEYKSRMHDVLEASGMSEPPGTISVPEARELKFPTESFRRLYEQKIQRFPMLFKKTYAEDAVRELNEFIGSELTASVRELKEYYHACNMSVEDLKVVCVEKLNEQLNELKRLKYESEQAAQTVSIEEIEAAILSEENAEQECTDSADEDFSELMAEYGLLAEQWNLIFETTDNEVHDSE